MGSVKRHANGRWRARYRDESGREHARHFARKIDAERWLSTVQATCCAAPTSTLGPAR